MQSIMERGNQVNTVIQHVPGRGSEQLFQCQDLDKDTGLTTGFSKMNYGDFYRDISVKWKGQKTHRSGLKKL